TSFVREGMGITSGRWSFSIRSISFGSRASMYSSFIPTIPISSLFRRGGMIVPASAASFASKTSAPASRNPEARSLSVTMTNLYIHELLPEVLHGKVGSLAPGDDPDIRDLVVLCPEVGDQGGHAERVPPEQAHTLPDKEPLELTLDDGDLPGTEARLLCRAEEPVLRSPESRDHFIGRVKPEEMVELLCVEFPAAIDEERTCVLRADLVVDHPEDRPEVQHVDLDREDIPDHSVVCGRRLHGIKGIPVIVLVQRAFEHGKVAALCKCREAFGERLCVRDAPGSEQVDCSPEVRLADEFGQGRFIKFAGRHQAVADLFVRHMDILSPEYRLNVLDVPTVEEDRDILLC